MKLATSFIQSSIGVIALLQQILLFSSSPVAAAAIDAQCRHISSNDEPVATADIVLVGSGPGGAGFLHRLVRKRPDLSVIWIEKGQDFKALNWPEDIAKVNKAVLTAFPRKVMTWITGYGWNNFGGGDAGNSGGANYLVTSNPYDIDVFKLRNNSVTPLTETTKLWTNAFKNVGYKEVPPQPIKLDGHNYVSQLSSVRTADGRGRLLLADDLRYNTVNRKVTYVNGRAASVIRDENGRAVGVRGVRIDRDQREYGGCVAWSATKAVVLAGGVFNSFDLLVESGFGPEKDLKVRDVPKSWWTPNEKVGKEVGDEHLVLFMHANAEAADQFGSQPKLIAEDTYGNAYEYWTKGLFSWFRFKNTITDILAGYILPEKLPGIFKITNLFFKGLANWGVGIDGGKPVMELEAIPKPGNTTLLPFYPPAVEKYMMNPYQSPFTLIKESILYKNFYKIGVIIDDSKVKVSPRMCQAIEQMMKPMEEGGKIQNEVKGDLATNGRRAILWLATKIGILKLVSPNAATPHNVKTFTGKGKNKGKKCSTKMFASYYHYFGGMADNVDDSYQVKGVKGLYVSDGSVMPHLTPGPSSASIMQTGMRVADALVKNIDH